MKKYLIAAVAALVVIAMFIFLSIKVICAILIIAALVCVALAIIFAAAKSWGDLEEKDPQMAREMWSHVLQELERNRCIL